MCRKCLNEASNRTYHKNIVVYRERNRIRGLRRYKENAHRFKLWQRANRLGITMTEAQRISDQPCAICGIGGPSAIDHCHRTGKIRGPLCRQCNTGIGMLQDDTAILRLALEYLEKHE